MDNLILVEEYMKFVAKQSDRSYEAVVLKYGRRFIPPTSLRPEGIRKGKDKECFKNAYHVCEKHGFTYVEGFALSILPTLHAWAYDKKNDRVIETTWRDAGAEYYGIPFDMKFVNKVILERGYYGVIDYSSESFRKFAKEGRYDD